MRRYDIVTGILLILSIVHFALAAPVLVQGNQVRVDVVHMPKDLTTVLGKRWEEELENLGEEYFKTLGKPVESSGTHSSSSSALSGPDNGLPPAPNPASSNVSPDSSIEPPCSSMQGLSARGNCYAKLRQFGAESSWPGWPWGGNIRPEHPDTSPLLDSGSDHESDSGSVASSSTSEEYDRSYWTKPEWTKGEVPLSRPVDLSQLKITGLVTSSSLPRPPIEFDKANRANRYNLDLLNLPSTSGHAPGLPSTESGSAVLSSLSGAESPEATEPGHEVVPGPSTSQDSESLSADSQPPVDLQAAAYDRKGKAKVPGTVRDVGNVA
jgi:hypothetical protein